MVRFFFSLVIIMGAFLSAYAQDSLKSSSDTLCFEPTPYVEATDTNVIGIQFCNLADSTIVEILSISGTLIRRLIQNGSNPLFWDLRDNYKEKVPTNMYIIKWQAPNKKVRMDKLFCIMDNKRGNIKIRRLPR